MRKNRANHKTQKKSTKRPKSIKKKRAAPLSPTKAPTKSPNAAPKHFNPLGTAAELDAARKIWYSKLRAEGFKDLETSGLKPHKIHDGALMGNSLSTIAKMYQPETELFYRRIVHYLTHVPNPMGDRILNQVCKMFSEGVSYREITRIIRAAGGRMNIHKVHCIVQRLVKQARTWNKINPNGVDFEADFEGP
jgi:hypothetical protein